MNRPFAFIAICLTNLLLTQLPAQELQPLTILQSQFQSLYNANNFDQVLTESDKRLLLNPEDIFARSWQTIVYLTRNDTINKQIKMQQRLKHLRYNFWLIEENARFLKDVQASNPVVEEVRQEALRTYTQLYGTLKIELSNSDLIGFFRAAMQLRLVSPFKLKRNQEQRLLEINESLARGATLHFNKVDDSKGQFFAELAGVPLLTQFEAGYEMVFPETGDTLFVEFNPEYQDILTVPEGAIDSAYYDLPPDYLLLFFDNDKDIQWEQPGKKVYSKTIGNKTGYLFPIQQVEDIRIDDRVALWRRAINWSLLGIMTLFLFTSIK